MKEREKEKSELPSSKVLFNEYVYTAKDGKKHYTKVKGKKDFQYGFYIRPYSTWFFPCDDCQKELHNMITETRSLILGNKSYEPMVELQLKDEINDDAWETLIDRVATEEDLRRVKNKELDEWD